MKKSKVKNYGYFWIRDFLGRNIENLLFKPLSANAGLKPHLLACKVLEQLNGGTLRQFVINCIEHLWSNSFEVVVKIHNNLIL